MAKNIFELEKLFQSEETLEKVLKYCEPYFDRIDSVMLKLRTNKIMEGEDVEEYLGKIAGYYGVLKPVLALAITEKKNRETRSYNSLKEEIEKEGKKFSSAPTERMASEAVGQYRRVRNLIQAYTDITEKIVGVLQSKLSYLKKETNF